MAKKAAKSAKDKRDGASGPVMVIPHVVLNSMAYKTLSGRAVKLLFDMAQQYNVSNNGQLLASWRYMSEKRGWTSADALNKAKVELLSHDLISQTVQGRLPNKASWYGITWVALDDSKVVLDIATQSWPRCAYINWLPSKDEKQRKAPSQKLPHPVRTPDT